MSTLTITFANQSGLDPSGISIGFFPGAGQSMTVTNNATGAAIPSLYANGSYPFAGNWIALSALGSGAAVTSFSGRIYVSYGTPWQVQGYATEPAQTPADPNFYLRYDKLEITFTGQPADVANLTSIDYWAIPLQLDTFLSTGPSPTKPVGTVAGLIGGATTQSLYDALKELTNPPVSGLPGLPGNDGAPLPAVVPGSYVQFSPGAPAPLPTFGRIIGPSSYPVTNPQGIPVTPYDLMSAYLQQLVTKFGPGTGSGAIIPGLGNGVIAKIEGDFAGVGPNVPPSGPTAAQHYSFQAVIDAKSNITLSGSVSKVSGPATLAFHIAGLLNPDGIYGGNCPFYFNGASSPTSPANDVYGWVTADLLAGLNIGAIGSTVRSPAGPPFGQLPSQKWFDFPVSDFFGKLQPPPAKIPGLANYNQWAATLAPLSEAYNFAYTDRFARVFAALNPAQVDTLRVTLLPAAVKM